MFAKLTRSLFRILPRAVRAGAATGGDEAYGFWSLAQPVAAERALAYDRYLRSNILA
jgi:hypothetical protein